MRWWRVRMIGWKCDVVSRRRESIISMNHVVPRSGLAAWLLVYSLGISAQEAAGRWPDTPLSRTQALAELQTLNADLLSHPSATLTLERWCGAHHLAAEAKVVARRVQGADKPLPEGARAQLGIGPDQPVRYRRVQLACGDRVLSDADNWYVPARLTAAMNQQLDSSDVPFGKVVQPLHFRRQTLSAELLWSPLPDGWDSGVPLPPSGSIPLDVPPHVLRHRAVLYTQDNQPFSLVIESYTAAVLTPPLLRVSVSP
jgi:chorismate-pyruvate lyase